MTYLEKLLQLNTTQEKVSEGSLAERSKVFIELSALPEDLGGGFYVTIPALGRWFAHTDGETIEEALKNLDNLLVEVMGEDEDYIREYKEQGIILP